jgi:hypothetical protein
MRFRENYSESDLKAACEHSGTDVADVTYIRTETYSPLDLLENMDTVADTGALKKYPLGWAQGKSKEEVLIALEDINKSTAAWWKVMFETGLGGFPPVILIDGQLSDGCHRCIFCYLYGEQVLAAEFKTKK